MGGFTPISDRSRRELGGHEGGRLAPLLLAGTWLRLLFVLPKFFTVGFGQEHLSQHQNMSSFWEIANLWLLQRCPLSLPHVLGSFLFL